MLRTVTTALELYLSDSIGLLVQEENQKRPRRSPQKGANLDKFFLSYDKRGVEKGTRTRYGRHFMQQDGPRNSTT